ncbi:NADPH dehydrogenase NamA [Clostridium sp. YIM B02515]|uniref:NADPH dehydrogenase NamA n=1 Tax=Clostridium rhizosphaerae TaxID=2803861 RepID=A0ABS1T942_9CLOT|nr:NADPH dehydrogenase NamA [Clostridium rhizosphaerae]MBL4935864.1 NADPH dehydrogenase NamA [Clostridium rhizosphaerae]
MSKLFSNFKIKDLDIKNRVVMAPMCMYSAEADGKAKEWHYIHYAARAIGGTGLIIQEATAVEKRGRISDRDLGIWEDSQKEGLKKIVDECKKYGAVMGIQLAHAGRKCEVKSEEIIAPSSLAFSEESNTPKEMSIEDIKVAVKAFKDGAIRAKEIGYDIIEIHGAHGYLINQFLSPLTNKRKDEYGGSLENRARFLKEVTAAVREVWPKEKAIILRVSAEDFIEEGNHPEDLAEIINMVKDEGIDIVNVSSGGVALAQISVYPGYQIRYAEIIKEKTGLPVIAGGLITSPLMAEEILQNGRADMVFLARELLRNPNWPLYAAHELKDDIEWPEQYLRGKIR